MEPQEMWGTPDHMCGLLPPMEGDLSTRTARVTGGKRGRVSLVTAPEPPGCRLRPAWRLCHCRAPACMCCATGFRDSHKCVSTAAKLADPAAVRAQPENLWLVGVSFSSCGLVLSRRGLVLGRQVGRTPKNWPSPKLWGTRLAMKRWKVKLQTEEYSPFARETAARSGSNKERRTGNRMSACLGCRCWTRAKRFELKQEGSDDGTWCVCPISKPPTPLFDTPFLLLLPLKLVLMDSPTCSGRRQQRPTVRVLAPR
jgi:hypothetical protein